MLETKVTIVTNEEIVLQNNRNYKNVVKLGSKVLDASVDNSLQTTGNTRKRRKGQLKEYITYAQVL